MRKKYIALLTALLLIVVSVPFMRAYAANQEKTIDPVIDSQSQKTFTIFVESGTDVNSVTYSGKGTLANKSLSGNQLTLTISGSALTEKVTSSTDLNDKLLKINPGNKIWRYSDGKTWQINSYNKTTNNQTTQNVTGYDADGKGIPYEYPAAPGSLSITTIANVLLSDAMDAKNKWIGQTSGAVYSNSLIDFSTWKLVSASPDPKESRTNYDGVSFRSNGSGGYFVYVDHRIHHNNYEDITSEAPAGIGTGGYVLGNNYAAPFVYTLEATSKAVYQYGGKVSYTASGGGPGDFTLDVTPKNTTAYKGNKVQYKAMANFADGSKQDVTNSAAWTSSNSGVAKVDNKGLATADGFGVTNVTASWSGKSDYGVLNVPATPTAILNVPSDVVAGDDFYVYGGNSFSPNGSIVQWNFGLGGANGNIPNNQKGGYVWYSLGYANSKQTMTLDVGDNLYFHDNDTKEIKIWPAYVQAYLNLSGNKKVNRKMTLDGSGSYAPSHYPLDLSKCSLSITPLDAGISAADIKYAGSLTGTLTKDFLVKKPGKYRATLSIENTSGLKDSTSIDFTVVPDQPPVADFTMPTWVYRDKSTNYKTAIIPVTNLSRSLDADTSEITWRITYNTNNDYKTNNIVVDPNDDAKKRQQALVDKTKYANFDDETPITFKFSDLAAGSPITQTRGQATIKITRTGTNTFSIESNALGRYLVDCFIQESYTDTIPAFISTSDYLSADTKDSKPLLERIFTIDNHAPEIEFKF